MSTAAVMLVKDEADVVGYTVRYLLSQVDHVYVVDNGSTDGTLEIVQEILDSEQNEYGATIDLLLDDEVAYYQARKTSQVAERALADGFKWVIPCDADEFWYATDGRRIADFLAGLAPDVAYVAAPLFNHLPSDDDPLGSCGVCGGRGFSGRDPREVPEGVAIFDDLVDCYGCRGTVEPNPFRRIGWRQREHGALPKVACRLRPGLEIRQGNHSAFAPGGGVTTGGLVVRHFSWRSADQYERKIANGARAYAATDLDPAVGAHWRMFGDPDDPTFGERVREHFETWFWMRDPAADASLIYDPAPWPTEV